jgi:tetratricopeptide (TPR) repeat protein
MDIRDVFPWLNEFDPSVLSLTATLLRDQIIVHIEKRQYVSAYQVIESFKQYESCRIETYERAEIWAECGLAFYQMGNPFEAIESLKQALAAYPPKTHEHAVTQWMLGAVQWHVQAEHVQAMINWQQAYEEFDQLKIQADKNHQKTRRAWYEQKLEVFEQAIRKQITLNGHPGPKAGPSTDADTESEMQGGKTDQYPYLVMLVSGDQAVADRLIAHERSLRPTASQSELIDLAIERLFHDRRAQPPVPDGG